MQRTLLNPKINFVFKKIFGSSDHPAVLKTKVPIVDVEKMCINILDFKYLKFNITDYG